MYPEAGGSSSLRAPRVQRVLVVLRRLGADAQLRGDDRDLARSSSRTTSAALFWDELEHSPGRRHLHAASSIAILGAINIVGVKESDGRQRRCSRSSTSSRSCCWCSSARLPRSSTRRSLVDNVALRRRADVDELRPRDPDRHARLHGHRDRLEHVRGGQGRGQRRSRRRSRACALAVFAIYFTLPAVALVALPVKLRRRRVPDAARACPDEQGGSAGDPIARRGARDGPRARCRQPAELYVGLLAATILFLATNAGLIGISPARLLDGHPPPAAGRAAPPAPEVPHAVDRDHRLQRRSRSSSRCRARRSSSAASTRSARCCRSRWRTWR